MNGPIAWQAVAKPHGVRAPAAAAAAPPAAPGFDLALAEAGAQGKPPLEEGERQVRLRAGASGLPGVLPEPAPAEAVEPAGPEAELPAAGAFAAIPIPAEADASASATVAMAGAPAAGAAAAGASGRPEVSEPRRTVAPPDATVPEEVASAPVERAREGAPELGARKEGGPAAPPDAIRGQPSATQRDPSATAAQGPATQRDAGGAEASAPPPPERRGEPAAAPQAHEPSRRVAGSAVRPQEGAMQPAPAGGPPESKPDGRKASEPEVEQPLPRGREDAAPEARRSDAAAGKSVSGAAPDAGPSVVAERAPPAVTNADPAISPASTDGEAPPVSEPAFPNHTTSRAAQVFQNAPFFAPPPGRGVAEQLAAAITRREDGDVELRLDPPELGRVRVVLGAGEHGLTATVTAERPEVAELMRRHADLLDRALSDAGHEGAELRFGAEGGDGRERRAPAQGGSIADAAAGAEALAPVRSRPQGGMDIRV